MKKIKITLISILAILILHNVSLAESIMQIISDKVEIEAEEEVQVSINIKDTEVAALTLELYWDNSKLEYISGPENSNNLDNRALYTWVSENAKDLNELSIENFTFKGITDGIANITAVGEFYNSNGEKIEIKNSNLEINIGKQNQVIENIDKQIENISDDNADLAILRLNHEGISPDFNKDIKEYYFVTDSTIQNLEITAIPQNSKANVTITGNNNLKNGENIINIKVDSKDNTKSSVYKIYLTKTQNLDLANANLETLAVRQATLSPEFDSNITNYNLEISNDTEKIDILAIPQKENAKVEIVGNGKMQVGENIIDINVLAENGTTHKRYKILVHRRNEQEEIANQEETENQAKRLSAILEEEKNNNNNISTKQNGKQVIIVAIIIIIIALFTTIIIKQKNKNKKK